jgi:hypothetical protein
MVLRLPNLDAETRREPLANFARENTDLSEEKLDELLDARKMTEIRV